MTSPVAGVPVEEVLQEILRKYDFNVVETGTVCSVICLCWMFSTHAQNALASAHRPIMQFRVTFDHVSFSDAVYMKRVV